MIRSREELEKDLTRKIEEGVSNRNAIRNYIATAAKRYDVPEKTFSDFLTLRKNVIEADRFMLYILTDILLENPDKYFSKIELKEFSKAKWHIEKAEFPIIFKMVQVNDEQYIGTISARELMKLKDSQLINYNENAQRTMKRIIIGESECYQISLNKRAVRDIINSYESDLYIPNTITLNMPEEASYYYDATKGILEIKEIEYFDILDGYHRYIAMSKIANQNPDFDYQMELRIVQFNESKANRFIWQEDQKTKMRKIDSDSMDSAKTSNKIVSRINIDNSFILSGEISRNKGIINAAQLADIIDILFLKGVKKSQEKSRIREVTQTLIDYIEDFTDKNPDYIKTTWDKITMLVVVYDYQRGNTDNILKDIEKAKQNGTIYQQAKLSQADITRLGKLLSEGG